jgi:ABC-type phosphate/phosphonate transport system substrate-binding protein
VGDGDPSNTAQAELGMYPFGSVRWAWDALWSAVHELAPWTPAELAHSGDVHARWADPSCVVNHVCGWPLARHHADRHRVVGTFSLTIPDAIGHRYRSVLVSPSARPLDELVSPNSHAVANSADSLSGWVSLLAATVGREGRWPGRVTFTSAHHRSLRVVAAGDADLACIDSWSLALIERQEPELTAGLYRVGRGPLVPSPAITVTDTVAPADADQLASAFERALADPGLEEVRRALMIDGFVRTSLADYLPTLDLLAAEATQ